MFSFKRVTGHTVVESGQFPGVHIVTGVAPFIKRRFVPVVMTVRAAGKRNPFPFFLFMAFRAGQAAVCALQRESRFSVIKAKGSLLKACFHVVTFLAGSAQPPVVSILVTADTPGVFDKIGP